MSGNKYELVNAAYTPLEETATRGALFFKIMFKQDDANLSNRDVTDSIVQNFITGTGAGWGSTTKAIAQKEIEDLVEASNVKPLTDAGAKYVVKSIMAARTARDAATDKATKDLMSRMLELYQRVYKIEQNDAAGTAQTLNVTARGGAPINLVEANTKFGAPATGAGNVGVTLRGATPAAVRASRGFIDLSGNGGTNLSAVTSTARAVQGATPSTWNDDKFFASFLNSTTSTSGEDAYTAIVGSLTGPKYEQTVDRNAKGELVMKTKTGDVEITNWSKTREICDNVVVGKEAGKDACKTALQSCLTENKDGKPIILGKPACMDSIKTTATTLASNIKENVKDMDPRAAFRLLKNCGYKGKKVNGLVRVEPWDEWVKRVKENKLTEDNKTAVTLDSTTASWQGTGKTQLVYVTEWVDDAKVQDFIKSVIGYIDSNKAILNKGAASGASAGYDVNDPFGRKRPRGNDKDGDLSDARVVIEGSLHNMHNHVLRLLGNMPIVTPNAISLLGMVGGSAMTTSAPTYVVQPHSGRKLVVPRFSDRLKEIYEHYLSRLKSMNKDLSEATKSKVGSVLDHVKEKEDELMKWVEYLQRYYEVAQLEGNLNTEEVGEEELRSAYQKYEKNLVKLRKRSINFIDILSTLSTATNDAESGIDTTLPSSI